MAQVEMNPRGIPKAPFVDKIEEFLGKDSAEATLQKFQETISKYKFMQSSLQGRQQSLNTKIPEIKKTLASVKHLISKRDADEAIETEFELNDTLYALAEIQPTQNVYLWLGANVMLEYSVEEARSLLSDKLGQATTSLQQVEEDLEFLRDQITTMEVNTARVYNWDVKQRKLLSAAEAEAEHKAGTKSDTKQ
ncbi:peptide chain release factor 1 [Sorochytrium milnesiophthora]